MSRSKAADRNADAWVLVVVIAALVTKLWPVFALLTVGYILSKTFR